MFTEIPACLDRLSLLAGTPPPRKFKCDGAGTKRQTCCCVWRKPKQTPDRCTFPFFGTVNASSGAKPIPVSKQEVVLSVKGEGTGHAVPDGAIFFAPGSPQTARRRATHLI